MYSFCVLLVLELSKEYEHDPICHRLQLVYKYFAPLGLGTGIDFQLSTGVLASMIVIVNRQVESVNAKRLEEDGRLPRVLCVHQFLTRNRTRQLAEAENVFVLMNLFKYNP